MKLNYVNCVSFLQFDREHFSEVFVDLKWFESKVGNKYLNEAAGLAAEKEAASKDTSKNEVCFYFTIFRFMHWEEVTEIKTNIPSFIVFMYSQTPLLLITPITCCVCRILPSVWQQ